MDEIGRWLRGVSQAVHARQSAPLGAPTSADSFFHTDTLDKTLLGSAAHAVYLTQETGALVTETAKHDLTRVLTAGGRVRMVVTTPTQNTASLLAFRNDNLHTVQALLARNVNFRHQLEDLLTRVGEHAERLEIRYLPYPVCSTTVIVDSEHEDLSKRRALVRYAGFQISYAEKPDFQLDGTSSPRLLDLILREFKTAFEHSSKINVITAPPRAGKTTSLQRLISQVKHDPNVFYAMTPAIWSSDVRVRFELQMSSHQDSIVFATRKSDGDHLDRGLAEAMDKYDVRQGALDTLVSELEVAHKEGKILILDEIGPLQIQDRRFVECIRRILDDESATLFATLSTSKHEFLDVVKRHPRSTVVHVDDPSRWEAVLAQLVQELKASQKLARLVAPRRQ